MLDPVDATFFEFVDACLNHVQTPMLQRKFAVCFLALARVHATAPQASYAHADPTATPQALGGIDLLVRLCAMSMNDEVIIKASSALAMLMQVQGDIVDPATGRPRRHAVVNALKIHGTGGVSALLAQLRRSRNERVLLESAKALKQLIRMRESQRGAGGDDEWGDRELTASCGDAFPVILSIFTRSQSVFVHAEAAEATYLLALSQECAPALAAAGAVETLAAHCESCRQAPVPSLSRPPPPPPPTLLPTTHPTVVSLPRGDPLTSSLRYAPPHRTNTGAGGRGGIIDD